MGNIPVPFELYDPSKLVKKNLRSEEEEPTDNNIYQTGRLMEISKELIESRLENSISDIKNLNLFDEKGIRGLIAEVIGTSIFNSSMGNYYFVNPKLEGRLIAGTVGYTVNQGGNYSAKQMSENRILILEKTDQLNLDGTQIFRTVTDLDGLYMVKTKNSNGTKKDKLFLPIEVKTGKIETDALRIYNKVIEPIKTMWGGEVHYALIGFAENLFIDPKGRRSDKNKLNNNLRNLYFELAEMGVKLIPLAFPINKVTFDSFARDIQNRLSGYRTYRAILDEDTGEMTLIDIHGKLLNGKFTPNN